MTVTVPATGENARNEKNSHSESYFGGKKSSERDYGGVVSATASHIPNEVLH